MDLIIYYGARCENIIHASFPLVCLKLANCDHLQCRNYGENLAAIPNGKRFQADRAKRPLTKKKRHRKLELTVHVLRSFPSIISQYCIISIKTNISGN